MGQVVISAHDGWGGVDRNLSDAEKRHGSTRVQANAFLA